MVTLLDEHLGLQEELLAAAWEPSPEPDPPHEPALPLAEWILAQASLYRSPAMHWEAPMHDDELALGLVADALQDLAQGVHFHKCVTPAQYLEHTSRLGALPSLEAVRVPRHRICQLALTLDAEAENFLRLKTDLGRLCAAWILLISADAEELGAETAAGYLTLCDLRDIQRAEELAADLLPPS